MTFVQENKEKNIRIEKMGITDISAVVRMCRRKTLFRK